MQPCLHLKMPARSNINEKTEIKATLIHIHACINICIYISVRIDCKITLTTKGSMKDARSFFSYCFLDWGVQKHKNH